MFTCKSSSLWESLWNLWNEETPSKKEAKTRRLLRPSPEHSDIPHSPNCTVASGSWGWGVMLYNLGKTRGRAFIYMDKGKPLFMLGKGFPV